MRTAVTDPAVIEHSLRQVQLAARLVRSRHINRVRRELSGLGDPLPIWVRSERLAALELSPAVVTEGLPAVLLLPEPDDFVRARGGAETLREYWRLLVQGEVLHQFAELSDAEAVDRLAALGEDRVAELCCVLAADGLVPSDAGPADRYRAFMAIGADALAFEPDRFGRLFPLLADRESVRRDIAKSVHLAEIVDRLRPPGAASAAMPVVRAPRRVGGFVADVSATVAHALRRGNRVRAAVALARAGDKSAARMLRDGFVADLARILGWDAPTTDRWDVALRSLLPAAAGAEWARATRCLYDLQRIVTDLSGDLTVTDPIGWAMSLGRRPLRRSLHHARAVRLVRHLSTAREHLRKSGLPSADRDRLDALLTGAQHSAEERVRTECEPMICEAIMAAGLVPNTLDERVALSAVAAEIVDRVCERGFARFADLRDALARNALKQPDLSGIGEWWQGDALLRADRRLGQDLAGVYRRAEVYLRVIHRGTAAAFGTPFGRWLSLWVLLPFGGGLMTVFFAEYVATELTGLWNWVKRLFPPAEPDYVEPLKAYMQEFDAPHHAVVTLGPAQVMIAGALGVLFLALIHSPGFRQWLVGKVMGAGRIVFFRLPAIVWDSTLIRLLRDSAAVRAVVRAAGLPALFAALVAIGLAATGADWQKSLTVAGATFVVVLVATYTPTGRQLEEEATEAAADSWRTIRYGFIPGLVAIVVELFRAVADWVERSLYTVDEWLRFRDRDGQGTLFLKAVAAAVWRPFAYILRFAFYLLVEPQVNPVKHFPVVTVSHKLLLPAVPSLSGLTGLSLGTTTGLVSLVPGVFGFIAWELKESWRLYAANRSLVPTPLPIGHHGETVRGLLVPGFHRGTVPKLYAKLRKANNTDRVERVEHTLHEVEHAVGRFVDRHLVTPLRLSDAWNRFTPDSGPIHLGVRTVEVTLAVPLLGDGLLKVMFTAPEGVVTARIRQAEWQTRLGAEQSAILEAALGRFCQLAGAEVCDRCAFVFPG